MASLDFDSKTQAFLQWFKSLHGSTFSEQIQIVDLRARNAGRGIVAVEDIPEDTVLFTIPRKGIINTETSQLRHRLPNLFVHEGDHESAMEIDDGLQQDPWSALILVMIFEYFQGDNSPWKPYLDVLPTSFETPMFWSNSEIDELQASALRSKIGKADAEQMFHTKLLPVIRRHPDVFPSSQTYSDEDLIQLAHRMGSAIMSYAFDFENEDEQETEDQAEEWVEDRETKSTMGMVPMADTLNADAEYNAHVNYAEDSLTVTTLRAIRAGEEILNYYGPHPNSELLRRYGYVTPRHSRYDVVEIPWTVVEAAVVTHLRISTKQLEKVRQHMDLDEMEDTFVLERESDKPKANGSFAGLAKFNEIPEDLQEQLKTFLKAIWKVDAASIPDKRKRDEVQHAVITKSLDTLEAQYSTTIPEDECLLTGNNLSERRRMAITVRLGEKKLLQEAKAYLSEIAADAAPDEPFVPSKKAKRSG